MDKIRSELASISWKIASLLATTDSLEFISITKNSPIGPNDLDNVIKEYGRTLIIPPENAYEDIDPIKIDGQYKNEWAVDVPLWTEEEGRSDLTLQLTIILDEDPPIIIIDDCHVM